MAETITKEQNIAYLEKGLYYSGFGIEANKPLNEHIGKKVPEFSIPVDMHVAGKDMAFRLDFRQSEKEPNMYFFNGYQATLKEDATKTQFFSISKNHGITAREAVNLLEGRAVAKSIEVKNPQNNEMSKEEMWTYIDFKAPRKDNGNFERKTIFPWDGFDIHKAMEAIPFNKEMPEWKLAALKKGNLVAHEMVVDGNELNGTMVVNLPFKTVDVYDSKGTRVFQANGNRLANYEKVLESWDAKKEDHPDIDRSFHEENAPKETIPQQQDEGQEKHDVPAVAENVPAHEVPALPETDKKQDTPAKNKIPERHRRPKKETSATENAPAKGVRR